VSPRGREKDIGETPEKRKVRENASVKSGHFENKGERGGGEREGEKGRKREREKERERERGKERRLDQVKRLMVPWRRHD
jgi:hypothetical protein